MISDSISSCVCMQLRLCAPTNDPEELLCKKSILKCYGEQKTLLDLQAEFYAIRQNSESVEDYFFHLHTIYEKMAKLQRVQPLQVMAEETTRDHFISQLQDVTI